MNRQVRNSIVLVLLLLGYGHAFSQKGYKRVKNINKVNSATSNELGLTIMPNGDLLFSSNRKSDLLEIYRNQDNSYFYNLYRAQFVNGNWKKPELFSKSLMLNDNITWPSISADGNTLYYVKTNQNNSQVTGIYSSKKTGKDTWSQPEAFPYNNADYNLISPQITADGNTLYFAANAPDGFGGYDIYMTKRKGNSWGEPENLGAMLNTDQNEISPFYHSSGKLFFASNGHNARGYDVFFSEKVNGSWIKPVPEGRNTTKDEFGWRLNESLDTLFYISNREGTDDIKQLISSFPQFDDCPMQLEETFCYLFEEGGAMDLDTTTMRYEWDFGDGTKERALSVKHCFEEPGFYMVQLNIIDTLTNEVYFSQASYDLLVEEVEQPYVIAPDTSFTGSNIAMNGEQSTIRSFEIEEYFWDFRDGNIDEGVSVNHTYNNPGEYFIILGLRGPDQNGQVQKKCVQRKIVILKSEE